MMFRQKTRQFLSSFSLSALVHERRPHDGHSPATARGYGRPAPDYHPRCRSPSGWAALPSMGSAQSRAEDREHLKKLHSDDDLFRIVEVAEDEPAKDLTQNMAALGLIGALKTLSEQRQLREAHLLKMVSTEACTPAVSKEGWHALHYAVRFGAPKSVIVRAIKVFPDALLEADDKGRLPLHLALIWGTPAVTVLSLLRASPQACQQAELSQRALPLHLALQHGADEEVALAILDQYPKAARQRRKGRQLPLHATDYGRTSLRVVDRVIESNPSALSAIDSTGRAPLHQALRSRADEDLIVHLLESKPRMSRRRDKFGRAPLHYAILFDATPKVVFALLRAAPASCTWPSVAGRLPLHLSAARSAYATEAAFEMLLVEAPGALEAIDNEGRTPLHLAAQHSASVAVVQRLSDANPTALRTPDSYGALPLHLCAEHNPSGRIALWLLRAAPDACAQCDVCRRRQPLHYYAARQDASEEVVGHMLEAYPDALWTPDLNGDEPRTLASRDGRPQAVSAIDQWVKSTISATAAKSKTKSRRTRSRPKRPEGVVSSAREGGGTLTRLRTFTKWRFRSGSARGLTVQPT
jgi:ankyrin repeat protein